MSHGAEGGVPRTVLFEATVTTCLVNWRGRPTARLAARPAGCGSAVTMAGEARGDNGGDQGVRKRHMKKRRYKEMWKRCRKLAESLLSKRTAENNEEEARKGRNMQPKVRVDLGKLGRRFFILLTGGSERNIGLCPIQKWTNDKNAGRNNS